MRIQNPAPFAVRLCTLVVLATGLIPTTPAAAQQQPSPASSTSPALPGIVLAPDQAGLKGMVGHWWYLERYGARMIDEYVRLGVTNVRLTVDWREIELVEGQRSFAHLDPIMDAFAERGIEVVPVVATVPVWAALNPTECASNTRLCSLNIAKLSAFELSMRELVARYPEARRWEFWNEPEMWAGLRRPSDYEPWYRAFYKAAKSVDPQIVVAVGTLSGWDFASRLSPDLPIDAVSMHPYAGDDWGLDTDAIQRLHDGLAARGLNVPIWLTEYGWAQWMDPARRARTLTKVFKWMQSQPYIQLADYHMLHDTSEPEECCWGLIGPAPSFTPHQPAYDSFSSILVSGWRAVPRPHWTRQPPTSAIVPPAAVPGSRVQTEGQSDSPIALAAPRGSGTGVGLTPTAQTSDDPTTYSVSDGDSLRSIAEHVYGDQDAWPAIYAANRNLIGPDPDALVVGTALRIPPEQ